MLYRREESASIVMLLPRLYPPPHSHHQAQTTRETITCTLVFNLHSDGKDRARDRPENFSRVLSWDHPMTHTLVSEIWIVALGAVIKQRRSVEEEFIKTRGILDKYQQH